MKPPQNPAGVFNQEDDFDSRRRGEFIATLADAPEVLRKIVAGLTEAQLDVHYQNWTIRQIVHHLADSHVNSYVRFRLALTEVEPTIKAYDEGRWADLEDARTGDVRNSLALLHGLHARWVHLLGSLTEAQFVRSFVHPETGKIVSLNAALCYYSWHCMHHTAQIAWVREQQGWALGP